ncbi:MAG: hypothetical protein ACJAYU_002949 [Bradymonadia bacterium]
MLTALPLLALIIASSDASAQTTDEQFWLSAGIDIEPVDDLQLSLSQMLRLDQSMTRIGKTGPELGLAYSLGGGFRLHAGYRFTADRRDEGDWRYENRVFFGARYRYDIGVFELGYRLEFQEDLYKKRGEKLNDNVIRNRFQVTLEVHEIVQPFVSFEALANIGGEDGTGPRNWRITVGTDLNFDDHGVSVFYRLRKAFGGPDTDHILGLDYGYSF